MKRLSLMPLLVLVACSSSVDPDEWEQVVGTIDPTLSSIQLVTAPTEVTADVEFTITVRTLGSSTCTQAAGAITSTTGRTAVVTPQDLVYVGDGACTDDLGPHPRDVQLRFTEPGEATIQIVGRALGTGKTVTYELMLPIRPAS